jgi:hypothetical protein
MDVHPTHMARWTAYIGAGSDGGQIVSNSLRAVAETTADLRVQGDSGGPLVSALPIALFMRGYNAGQSIDAYAYSIAGASTFRIIWSNNEIAIQGYDEIGGSFRYQSGYPNSGHPLTDSTSPHSMAVWCDGAQVVIALDGVAVLTDSVSLALPSLEELSVTCGKDGANVAAIDSVGLYQGITLSEAIALTA